MKIILALTVAIVVIAIGIFGYCFALKDAISMYPRSKKPVDDDTTGSK